VKTGGNGKVAIMSLEDFFGKKITWKNCGSPSIFKTKILEQYD